MQSVGRVTPQLLPINLNQLTNKVSMAGGKEHFDLPAHALKSLFSQFADRSSHRECDGNIVCISVHVMPRNRNARERQRRDSEIVCSCLPIHNLTKLDLWRLKV